MWGVLFLVCLAVLIAAKLKFGTDSKIYEWVFWFAFGGMAISVIGIVSRFDRCI